MSPLRRAATVCLLCPAIQSSASIIDVPPGTHTITAAVARAQDGDTLRLFKGEYIDSIDLPFGVSIIGTGESATTVRASGAYGVSCVYGNNSIAGIRFYGGSATITGLNCSTSTRIERCSFHDLKHGIMLMHSPMTDVIACDFVNCDIGIDLSGHACPSIWGSSFSAGQYGIVAQGGAPQIDNCLFRRQRIAIRLGLDGGECTAIRHSIFSDAADVGVRLVEGTTSEQCPPLIANNVFDGCRSAIEAPRKALLKDVRDDAVRPRSPDAALLGTIRDRSGLRPTSPAFRLPNQTEALSIGAQGTFEPSFHVAISADGAVALSAPDGQLMRFSANPDVGLQSDCECPGSGIKAPPPPIRHRPPTLAANTPTELDQYLRALQIHDAERSIEIISDHRVLRLEYIRAGTPHVLLINIDRYTH